MSDLARSMMRLSWAAPLFGAAQLASALRAEGGRLGSSLDAVTWTGHRHLGLGFQALLQTADDLGGEWVDHLFDALEPGSARGLGGVLTLATRRANDTLRIVAPGETGSSARQELRNKLEVYFLVRGVRRRLGLPPAGQPFALAPFVERALADGDPYAALWVIEGLGHDYASWQLALEGDPSAILTGEEAPAAALLMLHAGLGLALAEHVLDELGSDPAPGAAARAVRRFSDLARANSRRGFADAARESLGLVTRCFYPHLVDAVGRALAGRDGPLPGYFWHGVGRAIYFLPVNFLPGYGSAEHAVAMARREAPDAAAEHNAVAGVAYAVALVNLSTPGVVEHLLRRAGETLRDGAFTEGLVSSLVMRRTTTPDDPGLEAFLGHRPAAADARVRSLWQELVSAPVAEAFRELDSGAAAAGARRGEVFRALTDSGEFEGVTRRAAAGRAFGPGTSSGESVEVPR